MKATKTKKRKMEALEPDRILGDLWACRAALALAAAIELDLFSALAGAKKTSAEVARACNATPRGAARLLDALVGLGYVEKKKDGRYKLAPIAEQFLVRSGPAYLGPVVTEVRMTLPGWMKLGEVVRSGIPVIAVDQERDGREFFPNLVRAIFPMSYGVARHAVARFSKKDKKRISAILDVAAGAAPWSIAFAQELSSARVTAADFPETNRVAKEFTARFGVADRYDYLEGNLRELDFGRDRFDLAILGHILHTEGAEWGQKLVRKTAAALREGGTLLVAEMVPNEERTGPPLPLLFGLNMLLHTEAGDVFTFKEIRQWMKNAGLKNVRRLEVPAPSPLILATK